jgi:hypothetical protein
MSRWPVLAASSIALLAGCVQSVGAGLANGPRLGGSSLSDEHVHDVISNSGDSCSGFAEHGPLRGRVPACAAVTHPAASAAFWPTATAGKADGLVVPWLKHFYVGWPCTHPAASRRVERLAWATPGPPTVVCTIP